MASTNPHSSPPEGRIIPFSTPDIHVEARRFGAAALDLVIILILQIWFIDIFGVTVVTDGSPVQGTPAYAFLQTSQLVEVPWLILLGVSYFSLLEALFGMTWGKLIAGIRVVDKDGGRPTVGAVLVRNIIRLADAWPLLYSIGVVGIIAAMTSPRRQRLGDRVAGTLVVRATSAPLAYRTAPEVRRRLLALLVGAICCGGGLLVFSYWGRPPLVVESLAHTASLFDKKQIVSYSLSVPQWGAGAVTYDMVYMPAGAHRPCDGTVTLRWAGFFSFKGGWVLEGSHVRCR